MRYKVSELAKILGVTTNTIRRYENNGYIMPVRDESDYRWYNESDISRIAFIRLYRKCGFSHQHIEGMLGSSSETVRSIYIDRLDEIDRQIQALKYLRHWLKDNIQLINTLADIGEGFMIMNCPPLKYVLYSDDGKLLTEKERLNTINSFMYAVHEVQLINIFKPRQTDSKFFVPQRGWAIKVMDIERLGLKSIITEDNPFIETYPTQKCLYGTIRYTAEELDSAELLHTARKKFAKRLRKYMQKNRFSVDGDIISFDVSILGDTTDMLVCIPVKECWIT